MNGAQKAFIAAAKYEQNLIQNIVVPAGQVYVIRLCSPTVAAAANLQTVEIDGKPMMWIMTHANFLNGVSMAMPHLLNKYSKSEDTNLWFESLPIIADEGQVITTTHSAADWYLSIEKYSSRERYNRNSDGGTNGKKRTIWSFSITVDEIAIGATEDILLVTPFNAAGVAGFPFGIVAQPKKRYYIHALIYGDDDTVGVNLARDGVRMLVDGREIITPPGVLIGPAIVPDVVKANTRIVYFPEPIVVNSFEAVQIWMRVTSTDAGAQDATLEAGVLMTEESLD